MPRRKSHQVGFESPTFLRDHVNIRPYYTSNACHWLLRLSDLLPRAISRDLSRHTVDVAWGRPFGALY